MKPARAVAAAAAAVCACLLPDFNIDVIDEARDNKNAVRILEPIEVTPDVDAACNSINEEDCAQPGYGAGSALPHFLDPANPDYQFCSCPDGYTTDVTLKYPLLLYIEDRDADRKGKLDPIYAAVQLDLDPGDPAPHLAVKYTDYIDPSVPLPEADLDYAPLERDELKLRGFQFGDDDQLVDLCNRADSEPLEVGFHTLRIVVTDRPWYRRVPEDGPPTTQAGVPDLARGATYDMRSYVFYCDDETNEDETKANYCLQHCISEAGL